MAPEPGRATLARPTRGRSDGTEDLADDLLIAEAVLGPPSGLIADFTGSASRTQPWQPRGRAIGERPGERFAEDGLVLTGVVGGTPDEELGPSLAGRRDETLAQTTEG